MQSPVIVLGSFVADVAFRASRLPAWGETLMGNAFALGPGGKGSNQAVAAARAGAHVRILSKLGDDAFGRIARDLWQAAGIDGSLTATSMTATGSAAILIDDLTGENAIIVVPGACFTLTPAEVDASAEPIAAASVFLTQLELPLETVQRGLEIAHKAALPTILNPAPAPGAPLPKEILSLVDYLIPNESEAALLTGQPVETLEQANSAARILQQAGARNVILTLGERGALVMAPDGSAEVIPAYRAGAVVETTGAGDAFCGGFAAALAEGRSLLEAAHFGSATAGLSVTRAGAAQSMPYRNEIDALLNP